MPALSCSARCGEANRAWIRLPPWIHRPSCAAVTLNTDASPVLVGLPGQEGVYSFRVGGSFAISHDTPPGVYAGSFVVTVLYN